MPSLWLPRLFAGFIAWLSISFLQVNTYISLIFILSFSHTLLAAFYSRTRAQQVMGQGGASAAGFVFLLAVAGACIWYDSLPMYYLILVHHILNEVYTSISSEENKTRSAPLLGALLAFEVLVFVACSPLEFGYFFAPLSSVWIGAGLLGLFGVVLMTGYAALKKEQFWGLALFSSLGLAGGMSSTFVSSLNIDFLILYHFLFWLVFPSLKTFKLKGRVETSYWMHTAVLSAMAVPFCLIFPNPWSLSVDQMSWATRAFAYFHIFSTLAVSASNPAFIISFFKANSKPSVESYEEAKIKSAV